jgi:hypothetical protein
MWGLIVALLVFGFYKLVEPLLADHTAWLMGIGWADTTWKVLQISYLALSNFDMTMPLLTVAWLIALGVFDIQSILLRLAIKLIPGLGRIFNI